MKIITVFILLFLLGVLNSLTLFAQSNTLQARFYPPNGYKRVDVEPNSFAYYLRHLPLKPKGSKVKYFDGRLKNTPGVYCAVVDLDIGKRDLVQCADAVMLLRAEFLYSQKRFNEVLFNFVSDGKPRYFTRYTNERGYKPFRKFMNYVFAYANTRSLHNQLKPVNDIRDMQPGDVFIQTGNPYGHAVIVVDMAVDEITGKQIYLLAQSYMPAQEIQILINPEDSSMSPWYSLNDKDIITPEWYFKPQDLRRF